jgi:hypothetical protein
LGTPRDTLKTSQRAGRPAWRTSDCARRWPRLTSASRRLARRPRWTPRPCSGGSRAGYPMRATAGRWPSWSTRTSATCGRRSMASGSPAALRRRKSSRPTRTGPRSLPNAGGPAGRRQAPDRPARLRDAVPPGDPPAAVRPAARQGRGRLPGEDRDGRPCIPAGRRARRRGGPERRAGRPGADLDPLLRRGAGRLRRDRPAHLRGAAVQLAVTVRRRDVRDAPPVRHHRLSRPLLHLRRLGAGGVFDTFAGHFEGIWAATRPAEAAA